MKEIWKDIKGYEGQYQVSNLGRVKSLPRTTPYINKAGCESWQFREGQLKKEIDNGRGYKSVSLYKDNKGKQFYIHRLVVEAFIGEIPPGMAVNHKDFDKSNNTLENLEIVTYSENNKHSAKAGRYDDKGGAKVKVYFADGEVREYPSMTKASKNLGIHRDTLIKVIHRGGNHGKKKFAELGISKIEQFK